MSMKRYIGVVAWAGTVVYLLIHSFNAAHQDFISAPGMAVHEEYTVSAPVAGNVRSVEIELLDPVSAADQVAEIVDPLYYQIKHRMETAQRDAEVEEDISEFLDIAEYVTPVNTSLAGTVAEIFVRPGEGVLPGQALMSVVGLEADYILAYLAREDLAGISIGTQVLVATRTGTVDGIVSQIGISMTDVPKEISGSVLQSIRAVPIRIRLLDDTNFRHGEIVEVRIPTNS